LTALRKSTQLWVRPEPDGRFAGRELGRPGQASLSSPRRARSSWSPYGVPKSPTARIWSLRIACWRTIWTTTEYLLVTDAARGPTAVIDPSARPTPVGVW